jgi:hypothetical protein
MTTITGRIAYDSTLSGPEKSEKKNRFSSVTYQFCNKK